MPMFVRSALLPLIFTVACNAAVASDEPTTPVTPPDTDTPKARHAWIVSPSEKPVMLRRFSLGEVTAELRRSLDESGCGDVGDGSSGEPSTSMVLETGAELGASFFAWAEGELGGTAPPGAPLQIGIGDADGLACVITVPAPTLERLVLRTRGGDPSREATLSWEIRPSGAVERAPESGVETSGLDVVPPTTTAALLLPAVQALVEVPPPDATADGYALVDRRRNSPPPPFEVTLSEADGRALYPDDAPSAEPLEGLFLLQGGTTACGIIIKFEDVIISGYQVSLSPELGVHLVRPAGPGGDMPQLASLRAAAPATLALDEVARLLAALEAQPGLTGDPAAVKAALADYWNGSPGAATSFGGGLGRFLALASSEEGLWAYVRLETAQSVFESLDVSDARRPEGLSVKDILTSRVLAAAAAKAGASASFPMVPGTLHVVPDLGGHDYRLALSAVHLLGEAAPLLVAAPPHALVGILPDEIDVMVASTEERAPEVRSVEARARRFLVTRDEVLASDVPTATLLERLALATTELEKGIVALRDVTELRFAATR